jgi:hypothetical protein
MHNGMRSGAWVLKCLNVSILAPDKALAHGNVRVGEGFVDRASAKLKGTLSVGDPKRDFRIGLFPCISWPTAAFQQLSLYLDCHTTM